MIKYLKYSFLFFIIASFSSCDLTRTTPKNFVDTPNLFLVKMDDGEKIIVRKDYNDGLSFENWNAYNVINTKLFNIERYEFKTSKNNLIKLKPFINSLSQTAPEWLKTAEVIKEINDVKAEYMLLLGELDGSTSIIRENCIALNDEFNELRENIHEVVENYKIS
ncbi:hypothetical protein [Winogradskyella sp.]|uniref:hypothetical protein n=1 Tax=Winogradskyella sp. TaxID=1883156 RepID=UPI0025D688F0|nr:hypothetical protein [Winogradskyella sp.]MBT8246117.1 hypothetical protein [Winogradskyella sp.]